MELFGISSTVVRLCLLDLLLGLMHFSFAANNELIDPTNVRCACPDEILTFTCTIVGTRSGATLWGGSAFDCEGNEIILIHSNFIGRTSGCNDGAIVGQSISVNNGGTCFTSQLNVTVSNGLNGKSVNCSLDSGMQDARTSVISVSAACSGSILPVVNLTDVSPGQLTFTWSQLDSECLVVQYVITSDCGNCSRSVSKDTSAVCSNLQLSDSERNCSFSIVSRTRGFTGTPSNPILVTLKVPDAPQVNLLPIYSSGSNSLIGLNATIRRNLIDFSIYKGISGSVVNYTVHYSLGANETIPASCTGDVCEYIFSTECPPSSDTRMNLSVSAANKLGPGQPSELISVGCTNEFVMVDDDPVASTLTCLFLNSPNTTTKFCSVEYGLCNQQRFYYEGNSTLEFPNMVTIQIDLPSGSDCYMYTVRASDGTGTVIVEGRVDPDGTNSTSSITRIVVPTVVILAIICIILIITLLVIGCVYQRRKHLDQPVPQKEMIIRAVTESDNIIAADSTDVQLTTDPMNSFKPEDVHVYIKISQ